MPAAEAGRRRRSQLGVPLAFVAVVSLGLVVLLVQRDDPDVSSASAADPGRTFVPDDASYRLVVPDELVDVPAEADTSIPSRADLTLELEGKVGQGGAIRVSRLSGRAASGTFEQVGEAAAEGYDDQYEGHPDLWGAGATVRTEAVQVGGRDAVEINAGFSPSGEPEPSTFFRLYFVDAPSGAPLLVTCDWNATETAAIDAACDDVVESLEVAA